MEQTWTRQRKSLHSTGSLDMALTPGQTENCCAAGSPRPACWQLKSWGLRLQWPGLPWATCVRRRPAGRVWAGSVGLAECAPGGGSCCPRPVVWAPCNPSHLEPLEVADKHSCQLPQRRRVCALVCPGAAQLQQSQWHAWAGLRHLQVEHWQRVAGRRRQLACAEEGTAWRMEGPIHICRVGAGLAGCDLFPWTAASLPCWLLLLPYVVMALNTPLACLLTRVYGIHQRPRVLQPDA